MRVKRRATETGIAGRLVALRTASVAGRLAALGPAGLASRLAALGLTCIAGLASCLAALCLTGITSITGVLVTGITGILTAFCSARVTRCLITVGTASACASEPKAFGALLRLAAACLISNAAKWLGWTFDSYGDGTIEIRVWYVGLSRQPRGRAQLYVKIKLVGSRRARSAGVFNDRIFFDANPRSLEPNHRSLVRGNRLGKYDIFTPELGVIGERAVKVESRPAFTVTFPGQPLQHDNVGWRRRGFRAQLLYKWVLIEKSFFTSISFLGSHGTLLKID